MVYATQTLYFLKRKTSLDKQEEQIRNCGYSFKETGLSISVEYHYEFLDFTIIKAGENIEALKHYFGITQQEGELVVRYRDKKT